MSKITDYNKPYELSRSRLMMQQKLNDRSKEAMMQRQITPEILPTKQEVKLLGLDDDRPDVIADKHRNATSIKIQLANISKNAIVDELGWKPSKIKSEVTQKMIDQYRAEMNQPVKIFDPTRGKDVIFKFKPSTLDLTPITPDYTEPFDAKEIAIREKQILDRLDILKDIDKYLSTIAPQKRIKIDDEYNRNAAAFKSKPTIDYSKVRGDINAAKTHAQLNEIGRQLGINFNASKPKISDKQIILNDKVSEVESTTDPTGKYEFEKAQLEREIMKAEEDQKRYEYEIDFYQHELNDNIKLKKQNAINKAEADKLNKAKINEAVSELTVLNSGRAIPEQQAGETDDEYRQRLVDIGKEVLDDDEVEREAGELQFVKAKYNLKELLSNDGKIETILKKLTTDEKTEFNTMFPGIKKKYLEIYGFNNSNMSVDHIVDFIKQQIPSLSASLLAPAKAGPEPEPEEALPAAATPATTPDPTALPAETKPLTALDKLKIYAKANGVDRKGNLGDIVYKIEKSGKQVPVNIITEFSTDIQQKLARLGLISYYSPMDAFQPTGMPTGFPPPPPPPRRSARLNPDLSTPTDGSGLGVHLKKLPKVIKLGHIHINPSNLYYEHILSVRNPKNKPLRAYKDEHLSDYLASLIIKLVEGGNIKKYELQQLSNHEMMIYDNLIKRSKLHTMNDNTFETTAGKMKQRLEVLEGELEAGNTNPEIKSEIHGLLFKLAHAKVISQVDANKHWKSIMEIY